ncbi:MAG: M48 family metalloprotease [Gammaproteobacteria bacterium]|nr:M48 family metalloprotease [Gammaproteobacteria bacterium]
MALLIVVGITASDPAWAKKKQDKENNAEQTEFGDAALGRKYHQQIVDTYGEYDINGLAEYVQQIGSEVAAHATGEKYTWHFTVLDDENINAFATPGGYVYVTRALIVHLNTQAQLAAVLGHEVGHITARHAARQYTAARVVGKVTDSIGPTTGFSLGTLFGAGLVRGYGREMELEADESGAQMIRDAGYDPHAMLEVIELLKARDQYDSTGKEKETGDPYHAMLASHPDKDRRLLELATEARESGAITRDDGRNEFLRHIDGIAWAGSAAQGVIRDSRFLHNDLDFALSFPEQWTIQNLPDRLLAWAPERAGMMQITLVDRADRKRRKIPVDKFLQKVTGLRRWQNARVVDINGLEGFIATAKNMGSPFGVRTGRIAVIFHGDNAFIFNGVTQDNDRQRKYDRAFDSIIKSTRRLAGPDRELAQPQAVRIVQVSEDSDLSAFEIENVNDPVALLRLLNGLYPDGEPQPGDSIKIIR